MNEHLESLFWIIFAVGYLSRMNAQTASISPARICFSDVCYINPSPTAGLNWTDAQQRCRFFNATLPIVDTPQHQESFELAVRNLTIDEKREFAIWLGAKASGSKPVNWTWLDGSKYNGTDLQQEGNYSKSYAYVSNMSTGVRAFASFPNSNYFYVCHYPTPTDACLSISNSSQMRFDIGNNCFVKYNNALSWFSARNVCLANKGDLASFKNISVLNETIVSSPVWIGLRNNNWIWMNTVTGISSEVTYTLWRSNQPDDQDPDCISTDISSDFPNWRDWKCNDTIRFICQVVNTTATTPEPTGDPSSITLSRASLTASLITVQMTTSAGTPPGNGSGIIPLAVGIGVGVGVPVFILIAVVIIIIVRRKHRNGGSFNKRAAHANSQSSKEFAPESNENNREAETSEMNERENGATQSNSSPSAQYATISEATRLEQDAADPLPQAAASQGIVYAPLSFDQ